MSNNPTTENSQPSLEIQTTHDGSHTLYRADLDETYHSHKGAVAESEYVFIDKGLEYVANAAQRKSITVFEVGLGTGLNALLSAQFGLKMGINIQFHTVEPFPVPREIYKQLNYSNNAADTRLFNDIHQCSWEQEAVISAHFHLFKYEQKLEDFDEKVNADVVFMDAFAPSKQAEVWALSNLEKCYDLLYPGGILVTYCAQGQFKRDLKTCGFEVEVLPGALGKKEMVRALKP